MRLDRLFTIESKEAEMLKIKWSKHKSDVRFSAFFEDSLFVCKNEIEI